MKTYITLAIISFVLSTVSLFVDVFFISLDDDEKEYYKNQRIKPVLYSLRAGIKDSIFEGNTFATVCCSALWGGIYFCQRLRGASYIGLLLCSGVFCLIPMALFDKLFQKLYYKLKSKNKLKYKRFHTEATKNTKEDVN